MTNEDLKLLDSKFVVERQSYDSGHGGSVPNGYKVKNNIYWACTVGSKTHADWLCDQLNELRRLKLQELLQDA